MYGCLKSQPNQTVVFADIITSCVLTGGCHNSLKPVGNGPTIAIAAAAAMVSVDPEGLGGPAPSSVQPCHFLTLAPIKIPLRTAPFSAEYPTAVHQRSVQDPRRSTSARSRMKSCLVAAAPLPAVTLGAKVSESGDVGVFTRERLGRSSARLTVGQLRQQRVRGSRIAASGEPSLLSEDPEAGVVLGAGRISEPQQPRGQGTGTEFSPIEEGARASVTHPVLPTGIASGSRLSGALEAGSELLRLSSTQMPKTKPAARVRLGDTSLLPATSAYRAVAPGQQTGRSSRDPRLLVRARSGEGQLVPKVQRLCGAWVLATSTSEHITEGRSEGLPHRGLTQTGCGSEAMSADKSRERGRAPCPPAPTLQAERRSPAGDTEDKLRALESAIGRCVVWTGDDRVFFFNPTMQLSVWEKPVDLRNRGDLNRIIEDPPHKRKLEATTSN
ncbi:hypothetical protein CB1_000309022 [Camelus ferus]|nr:hypothetical protein CB1_000309022 [Camelus ferus]